MAAVRFFVPGEVSPRVLPFRLIFQEEQTISHMCASAAPHSCCCKPSAPGLSACLLPESRAMLSRLYLSQALPPLKLQSLSPAGRKDSRKSTPRIFPVHGFGLLGSCTFPCVLLYLSPFSANMAPSPPQHLQCESLFSPQPCLPTSYLPPCSLFSPFSCGVLLFVSGLISGVFRMTW